MVAPYDWRLCDDIIVSFMCRLSNTIYAAVRLATRQAHPLRDDTSATARTKSPDDYREDTSGKSRIALHFYPARHMHLSAQNAHPATG
jgi:hypothetical protein